ncbi:hypothetical protein Tco_0007483, partial [Tanacetum coccineum]
QEKGKERVAFDGAEPLVKRLRLLLLLLLRKIIKSNTEGKTPAAMKRLVTLGASKEKIRYGSALDAIVPFITDPVTPSPPREYQHDSDSKKRWDSSTRPNTQRFIISSDSTHTEPLNACPFASLKSVSNPLPKQNKAVTVATSLVYEAGTLSSILDNASPVNDFYKSHNIDYVDAKNVVTFEKKFLKREEDVKRKDKEIANIKPRLENFEGDSLEVVRLYSRVSELGVAATARVEESASHMAKNVDLIRQVSDLEALCDDLKNQIKGEDQLRKEFIAMQDSHANSFEDHATELGESLTTLDIDFNKELFPNMMKAVSSKRLDKAISLAIKKGNQQGLEVRLVRGKADKNSKDIQSYDAEAGAKFLAAVKDLEDVPFPLLGSLEVCKDYFIEFIMSSLTLEGKHDASRVRATKKRKRNASLDVVAEAMDASQLSSSALTIEMPVVTTVATPSMLPMSSAALGAGIIVHTKAVDLARSAPEVATDGSVLIVFVSQ